MFGLGPQEMIFILFIALLLFGPKKLPELGRSIGKAIREFKKATSEIEKEVNIGIKEIQQAVNLEDHEQK
ncbi:MAG: TatA/E family twin arginine-targeting protein translocase [Actinobacteria bacterium]|nr:TatA/E family twin arginine-targeting protein translocase [Actinomycetota bacterium]